MSLLGNIAGAFKFQEPQAVSIEGPGLSGIRFKDASVTEGLQKLDIGNVLRALTGKKIGGDAFLQALQSTTDGNQITRQEWNQIRDWAAKNFDQLSPLAQKLFTELDLAVQPQLGRGSASDDVVLAGPELDKVFTRMALQVAVSSFGAPVPAGKTDGAASGGGLAPPKRGEIIG